MTYRIAVIVGSLRKDSTNRRLAEALAKLAPEDFAFLDVGIGDLPLYDRDDDDRQPEPARRMKAAVESADGVLFGTPEDNRSIPGVLKNALDHGSRPYGNTSWAGRPAAIVGVSPGGTETALAQQHLRNALAFLDMPTMGQPETFIQWTDGLIDDRGAIGDCSRTFFQGWMDRFADLVRTHAGRSL